MPSLAIAAPLIVGDGIHDDTEGLRALLLGLPFRTAPGCDVRRLDGTQIIIANGVYRFGEPLDMTTATCDVSVHNCALIADERCAGIALVTGPMARIFSGAHSFMRGGVRFKSFTPLPTSIEMRAFDG